MINIPKTSGKFHYMSQHKTMVGIRNDVKKLGLKKGKYIVKKYSEKIEPFFFEKWFNKNAKTQINTIYVLFM
ncbi:MAG: hypothetical protein WCT77_00285 [Bacteroidota bacterium]